MLARMSSAVFDQENGFGAELLTMERNSAPIKEYRACLAGSPKTTSSRRATRCCSPASGRPSSACARKLAAARPTRLPLRILHDCLLNDEPIRFYAVA